MRRKLSFSRFLFFLPPLSTPHTRFPRHLPISSFILPPKLCIMIKCQFLFIQRWNAVITLAFPRRRKWGRNFPSSILYAYFPFTSFFFGSFGKFIFFSVLYHKFYLLIFRVLFLFFLDFFFPTSLITGKWKSDVIYIYSLNFYCYLCSEMSKFLLN